MATCRLYDLTLTAYFRLPGRKTLYEAITYPTMYNPHSSTREVMNAKTFKSRKMKCSIKVIPVNN